jgi:hypothetical protein
MRHRCEDVLLDDIRERHRNVALASEFRRETEGLRAYLDTKMTPFCRLF